MTSLVGSGPERQPMPAVAHLRWHSPGLLRVERVQELGYRRDRRRTTVHMPRESRVTKSSEPVVLDLPTACMAEAPGQAAVSRCHMAQRAYLAAVTGWYAGSGGEPSPSVAFPGAAAAGSAGLKHRERRDARPRISAISRRRPDSCVQP
ncbi:hypothetical protein CSAL01_04735 [Colletotrichum salicis]|uniref:Uncharacterized protein n=1 Tax=Colletotrichum salicis TaxID=1209931 RepID=A0A135U1W5_9PEZI|nr:hypothetical protein CSAL01_04735 [Colletotrichum salicis]